MQATRACTSVTTPVGRIGMSPCVQACGASSTPFIQPQFLALKHEQWKANVRAKVEPPFDVLKRQFGYTKVRYRGLAENTAQIVTLPRCSIFG